MLSELDLTLTFKVTTLVLYFLAIGVLAVYGFHRAQLLYLYWKHLKHARPTPARFSSLPRVTVQLPIFNEYYVVERLLRSVTALDYPRHLLDIQILDDSTDDTRELAASWAQNLRAAGIDITHLHREDRTGYKAGALGEGTKQAKGEFILILDADFEPRPNLIEQLVHYFTDPKVGMVQGRWGHINREYSLLTRVQAMMLDGHFIIEHIARNRSGRFFNFNGTAGMWRKSTIEAAGGWHHDTVAEDMDLSIRAQMRGWDFVYVPDAHVPAELPCEMTSFKTQQYRWAKGHAQIARKLLPVVLKSDLPLKIKLEAVFHLTNNFAYLFLVLLAMLQLPNMLIRSQMQSPWWLLLDVPLFVATCGSITAFYIVAHRALYPNYKVALKRLPMTMAVGIGLSINNSKAVLEGLFSQSNVFVRTPKHGNLIASGRLKDNRYCRRRGKRSYVEFAFAVYFILTMAAALLTGSWPSIPFLILFTVGFVYVGFRTRYPGAVSPQSPRAELPVAPEPLHLLAPEEASRQLA